MFKDSAARILWETLIKSEQTHDKSVKKNIEKIKKEIKLTSSSNC